MSWGFYRIYPVVKPDTGEFSGTIDPYNEYYLVAYLANITSEESNSKVRNFPHHSELKFLKVLLLGCPVF